MRGAQPQIITLFLSLGGQTQELWHVRVDVGIHLFLQKAKVSLVSSGPERGFHTMGPALLELFSRSLSEL